MNHYQTEIINYLKQFFYQYKEKLAPRNKDLKAQEADLQWGASRFLATLIKNSKPFRYYITEREFLTIKKDYEKQARVTINTKGIIQKYWLRNVLGFIEIPKNIHSLSFQYEKIKDNRNELTFLLDVSKGVESISKNELKEELETFEQRHAITIDKKFIYEKNWLKEKEELYTFSNLFYYEPIIDNWNEVDFIYHLYEKKKEAKESLLIPQEVVENTHKSFKNFFPEIPDLKTLIHQKILSKHGHNYSLHFYNTSIDYWNGLADKIGGTYWELLISDNKIATDEERVKLWLRQTIYRSEWSKHLLFTSEKNKERFLDAALNLLLNEKDIEGVKDELLKVRIDSKEHSNLSEIEKNKDELNNDNLFELMSNLDEYEKHSHITLFYGQDVRTKLSFLVNSIVNFDNEASRDDGSLVHYNRVKKLVKAGLNKPYLLWNTAQFIVYNRPEIIPYFLVEKEMASLALILIDKVSFPQKMNSELKLIAWEKSIQLSVSHLLQSSDISTKDIANFIFQTYRQLNGEKYHINTYNQRRQNNQVDTQKKIELEKEVREKTILKLLENYPEHGNQVYKPNSTYLIPVVYQDLYKCFRDIKTQDFYKNGLIQFPLLQWDGLVWLIKCLTYRKYQTQLKKQTITISSLADVFLTKYLDVIEQNETLKYNFFENKEELGIPIWSERLDRLRYIDWIYPIYYLKEVGKLNHFLSPRFKFEETNEYYHKSNQYNAKKLKTHIGILLQVLRKLNFNSLPFGFDINILSAIKEDIEKQIITYLTLHSVDKPIEGKVDLFESENTYFTQEKEYLLPQIAQAINWFKDKNGIIQTITNTGDIQKILTVVELVTSEEAISILLKKIKTSDVKSFFKSLHWAPQVQYVLIKMAKYTELIQQVEESIGYWEKEVKRSSTEKVQNAIFQAKLLLAYHNQSEKELDKIRLPEISKTTNPREFTYNDDKQFYRGLIRVEKDPESAYDIYNQLLQKFSHEPVLALNRFAAKIRIADKKENQTIYRDALQEWYEFKGTNENLDFSSVEPNIWVNELKCLFKTGDYEKLEEVYQKIEYPYKMTENVLTIRTKALLHKNRDEEAIELLNNAKNYHKLSDDIRIQFIDDLEKEIKGVDNFTQLRNSYLNIFSQKPKTLIKIFPPNLNGKDELKEFITNEVALAANKMLDKIQSISEIRKEDKYNDLVQLALESRVNPWGWQVKDQTRKAFSASARGLGEIDIDIQDKNARSFMTCEAFIFSSKSVVQSHMKKLIKHYTHNRKAFIILVYDLGKQYNFEKKWKRYCEEVVPNITFPIGYKMKAKKLKDVTKEFEYESTGIRIGKALHGKETYLYHVFVNIDYKVK